MPLYPARQDPQVLGITLHMFRDSVRHIVGEALEQLTMLIDGRAALIMIPSSVLSIVSEAAACTEVKAFVSAVILAAGRTRTELYAFAELPYTSLATTIQVTAKFA